MLCDKLLRWAIFYRQKLALGGGGTVLMNWIHNSRNFGKDSVTLVS
jgi:hypothetical protein